MANQKISTYLTEVLALIPNDRLDISKEISPGVFDTQYLKYSTLLTELNGDLTVDNLYTADGALTGNRIVSLGVNELTFSSTGDANLLRLETTNDRIGVGIATPDEKLHIVGNTKFAGQLSVNTAPNAAIQILVNSALRDSINLDNSASGTTSSNVVVARNLSTHPTGDAIGVSAVAQNNTTTGNIIGVKGVASSTGVNYGAWFEASAGTSNYALVTNGGNVGLGTQTPTASLEVVGNIKSASASDSEIGGIAANGRLKILGGLSYMQLQNASLASTIANHAMTQDNAGNTTINSPLAATLGLSLRIDSNIKLEIKNTLIRNLVATDFENYLRVAGDGGAMSIGQTTDTNTALLVKSNRATILNIGSVANTFLSMLSSGNVGIGTAAPSEKLEVVGNIYANTGAVGIGVAPSATRRLNVKSDGSDSSIAWFRTSTNAEVLDLKENRTILMTGNTGSRFAMGTTSAGASVVRVRGDAGQTDVFSVIDSSSADILVLSEDKTVKLESAASSVFGFGGVSTTSTIARFGASTTVKSSMRIIQGTAPTSPADGDLWTTTAGIFVRINGATVGPLS